MAAPHPEEQLALVDQIIEDPNLSAEQKLGRLRVLRWPKSHSNTTSVSHVNGASTLSPDQTLDLIFSNLQEKLDANIIEDIVRKQSRPLKIYWGKLSFNCQNVTQALLADAST